MFEPAYGWLWSPNAFGGGGPGYGACADYSPVTGTWLRGKGGNGPVGIVPTHPLDRHGKVPLNLARGVFPVNNGVVARSIVPSGGVEWKSVKTLPTNTVNAL